MSRSETFAVFAEHFVNQSLRERVVHEALKKPDKLLARVCHHGDDLFPAKYRNAQIHFELDDPCVMLGSTIRFQETTWRDVVARMGMGNGMLVVDATGRKFYAESEGTPRIEVWAGALQHASKKDVSNGGAINSTRVA